MQVIGGQVRTDKSFIWIADYNCFIPKNITDKLHIKEDAEIGEIFIALKFPLIYGMRTT